MNGMERLVAEVPPKAEAVEAAPHGKFADLEIALGETRSTGDLENVMSAMQARVRAILKEGGLERDENQRVPGGLSRRDFLKATLFGAGSLAFGGSMLRAGEAAERALRSSRLEDTINELGVDLIEIARRYGFRVDLDVENPGGLYVIHVAQIHDAGDAVEPGILGAIADYQVDMSNLLELLRQNTYDSLPEGRIPIFIEGAVLPLKEDDYRIRDIALATQFDFEKNVREIDKQTAACDVLESIMGHIEETGEKALDAFDVNYCRVVADCAEKLSKVHANTLHSEEDCHYLGDRINTILEKAKASYTEEQMEYLGAVHQMFFDGRADLYPTEEQEVLFEGERAVYAYLALAKELAESVDKAKRETKGSDAHRKLLEMVSLKKRELDLATSRFSAVALRPREDVCVRRIKDQIKAGLPVLVNGKMAVLIFGLSHKFKDAIEANNKFCPEEKLGLITLRNLVDDGVYGPGSTGQGK